MRLDSRRSCRTFLSTSEWVKICVFFIIKLSSWLFFFTYLGDEESPRKRKKRKKRKVHRMTEGTQIKFQFIQFLTIYKRETLRDTSLPLRRDMCPSSFCLSNNKSCFTIMYKLIDTKLNQLLLFFSITRRWRNFTKEKKAKEAQRTPER